MNKQAIELKQDRDFSDVFNAAFAFITQEFKQLFKVIALYAGLPIILAVIMNVYFVQDYMTAFMQVIQGSNSVDNNVTSGSLILLTIFFSIIATLFISGLVPAYMGEYEEKGKGNFSSIDVWKRFIRNLGAIFGYSFVVGIIVLFGMFLFFIPGIYFLVPLSLILYIKIIEGNGFRRTFSRSFKLIRKRWWVTFGVIILAYIIIAIVGALFSFPAMIMTGIEGFLYSRNQIDGEIGKSIGVILTNIIGNLGQYLVYPALYIIIGFQYYSLREQKDREVLLNKVSAINSNV